MWEAVSHIAWNQLGGNPDLLTFVQLHKPMANHLSTGQSWLHVKVKAEYHFIRISSLDSEEDNKPSWSLQKISNREMGHSEPADARSVIWTPSSMCPYQWWLGPRCEVVKYYHFPWAPGFPSKITLDPESQPRLSWCIKVKEGKVVSRSDKTSFQESLYIPPSPLSRSDVGVLCYCQY